MPSSASAGTRATAVAAMIRLPFQHSNRLAHDEARAASARRADLVPVDQTATGSRAPSSEPSIRFSGRSRIISAMIGTAAKKNPAPT